jgi:hypothetical protein
MGAMRDIGNTLLLWTVNRSGTLIVLAPGMTGTPEPVYPSPILHRAAYRGFLEAGDDLSVTAVNLWGRCDAFCQVAKRGRSTCEDRNPVPLRRRGDNFICG